MSLSSGEPTVSQTEQLSVAQIYNIVKDCDYWDWNWNGNVKAFKGDKEISLKGEGMISNVQFYNGWIYYEKIYDEYGDIFDIYRVSPNGENVSVVLSSAMLDSQSVGPIRSLAFVNGYMYIKRSYQFFQYNLETKEIRFIDGDVSEYQIVDNKLYFVGHMRKDFTIYVDDLETKERKILLGDGVYGHDKQPPELYYSNFIFIDDIMYYTKRKIRENTFHLVELYRFENGKSTLIDNTESIAEYSLFENDGKLCYLTYTRGSDIYKLMQYNPQDGKAIEVLSCNDFRDKGKIANGYFYYLDSDGNAQWVKMQQ